MNNFQNSGNQTFTSIRGLDLTFCKLHKAKWLGRTWKPKNAASFLDDCINILNVERPNWFKIYLNDIESEIQLHPRWELLPHDKVSYYHELGNGLLIKNNFSKTRICEVLVDLLDHELGMPTLPEIIYERLIPYKNAA